MLNTAPPIHVLILKEQKIYLCTDVSSFVVVVRSEVCLTQKEQTTMAAPSHPPPRSRTHTQYSGI